MVIANRPIVVTEVVGAERSRNFTLRVFCEKRSESVPLDICRVCAACAEIAGDPSGETSWVSCASSAAEVTSASADLKVGAIVNGKTLCVRDNLPIADLMAIMLEQALPLVFVVDSLGAVTGVVSERDLIGRAFEEPTAAIGIMSTAHPIHETDPLHRALLQMASSRSRIAPIVTENGLLLGIVRDLEAMAALNALRRGR
jgi:CBS domain-containing protein